MMLKKTVALFFCFIFGSITYSQQLTLSQIKDSDADISYFYDKASPNRRSNNEEWRDRVAYIGGCVGTSLGYNAGNGIIFLDALYLIGLIYDYYDSYNTGLIVRVGYKAGIGKRNK